MSEPLAVVGGGYVGLVSAVGLAELGHHVHCIEANPDRLAMLRDGRVPFFEPGLEEGIHEHRDRLHFAGDHEEARKECRLFFVAVGTPTSETGEADLRAVWSVIDAIPLASGQAVVMKSTVPPGTGAEARRRLDARGLTDVPYVSSPEFLSESTGLSDFRNPDKVVIGDAGTWAGDAVAEVYAPLVTPDRFVRTDVTTAETLKLAANAFLAAKISFINEIANLCDAAGADVTAVARAVGLDPRIGPMFLRAGIGFGGSCFGKDLKSLRFESSRLGARSEIVDAVLSVNDHQWERVLDKLTNHLGPLDGRTVAVLGVAFKPGTSNVKDANSIPVLAGLGAASVKIRAYDPKATVEILRRDSYLDDDLLADVRFCDSPLECLEGADAAVLVTEWPEILALDWSDVREAMTGTVVVDGRNALDPAALAAAGLDYDGIGRPPVDPVSPDYLMAAAAPGLRLGFIEPDLLASDDTARLVELTNRLVEQGHEITFYLPDDQVLNCTWMRCEAQIKTWTSGFDDPLDVLVFDHEPHWWVAGLFLGARRTVFRATQPPGDHGRSGSWESLRAPVDLVVAASPAIADGIAAEIGVRPVVLGDDAIDANLDQGAEQLAELLRGVSDGTRLAPPPPRSDPPDDPVLSVVVLAWDNLHYTQAFVESVRRHTDVPYELIIADNGSRWDAAAYAAAAADVPVLNDRNLGFAAGMNTGGAVARGRHIAFCNNDTVMPPGWASKLVETADAHPRAGIVVPALTAAGTTRTVRTEPGDQIVVLPPFSGPPPAVIFLLPREVSEGVGGWGEEYPVASGEDVDLGFKVWVNDLDIVYDERVLVAHVGKASASKLDDWQSLWAENRRLFLAKWTSDAEVPRIASCDEATFARNRAIAASTAEWMTKYFTARDKPAKVRTVVERSPLDLRIEQLRSQIGQTRDRARVRAAQQTGRTLRRLRRRLPPPVTRSVRTVLVRLPPQVEDSLRHAARGR